METRVHISLEVRDVAKSVDFYSKLFRTEPTKTKNDYANFRLENPNLHLALVSSPSRKPEPETGMTNRHYGIELFSDEKLDRWLSDVSKAGLNARIEEETTCCYAVANKFWARDPDGHEWEFWVRHGEANSMKSLEPDVCATEERSCCVPGKC